MRYVILVVLVLGGCATATPVRTNPTGPGEYFIECNGLAVPWAKCFAKANQMCPNGYDIAEQATENGPITGSVAGGVGAIGQAQYKHLRVKCK